MFFIPLTQIESVQMVVNALRAAGGEADCTTCPAKRACSRQCLAVADSIARMMEEGTLPCLGADPEEVPAAPEEPTEKAEPKGGKPSLKVIK